MTAPQEGAESILDHANAAPLASDAERGGFWRTVIVAVAWVAGVLAVGICVGVAILHFSRQYAAHTAQVKTIQAAPVLLPPVVDVGIPISKPKSSKTATNKIAAQALNTPTTTTFEVVKPQKPAEPFTPSTPAEQDFAKQLAALESKL